MKRKLKYAAAFALLLCFSIQSEAQKMPAFSPEMNFNAYSKKMNAYFEKRQNEERRERDKQGRPQSEEEEDERLDKWKRLEWYFNTRLDAQGRIPDIQNLRQVALEDAAALKTKALQSAQSNKDQSTLNTTGNWSQVGPTSVTSFDEGIGRVNRLAFHPSNVNIIWAATAGGGLWKTTNGGSSWAGLTDGIPNLNLSGVAVNKTNTNILYILTGDGDASFGAPARFGVGKNSIGVLKTVDGGTTWSTTGLKWKETDGVKPYNLVMHPSDFNILFAATSKGLWRSANGGATWTNYMPDTTIYDVEFMPSNGLVVYAAAAGGRFYRSMDAGVTWSARYDNSDVNAHRVSTLR